MSFRSFAVLALTALGLTSSPTSAGFRATYSATSGSGPNALAAEAVFAYDGNWLTITLTNTATATNSNAAALHNLYFNVTGGATLSDAGAAATPADAATASVGSSNRIRFNNQFYDVVGTIDVGGEYGFATGPISTPQGTFNVGIGSAGRGVLGSDDAPMSGLSTGTLAQYLQSQYGVTGVNAGTAPNGPTGGLVSTTVGGVNGNFAFVSNSVVFRIRVIGAFSHTDLGTVGFAYGTSAGDSLLIDTTPDEVVLTGTPVPAPAGLVLLASAAPFALLLRRLRRQPAVA